MKPPFLLCGSYMSKDKAWGQALLGTSPLSPAPLQCLLHIPSTGIKGLTYDRWHWGNDYPWGHKIYLTPWSDRQEHGKRVHAPATRDRQYDGRTWGSCSRCGSLLWWGGCFSAPAHSRLSESYAGGKGRGEEQDCDHQLPLSGKCTFLGERYCHWKSVS